jgi:hypothetical protein
MTIKLTTNNEGPRRIWMSGKNSFKSQLKFTDE